MRCLACTQENPSDAAFCGDCGTSLLTPITCVGCGRTNPPELRFCRGCGARLQTTSPAPTAESGAGQPLPEQRLAAIETAVDEIKSQVGSLVRLREQLNQTLEGLRGRRASVPSGERAETAPGDFKHAAVTSIRTTASREPTAISSSSAPRDAPRPRPNEDLVTIIHLDDHAPFQEALEVTVGKFGYARYCREPQSLNGAGTSRRLLALNLMLQSRDPLTAVTDAADWGIETPAAFTYCSDGTRGFALGIVDFFPPPFDPHGCVTRLLERPGSPQHLLVVSDALEATTDLRTILTRLGCPTSVAFDARQALELVPMIRPDVILLDLNLPRAEALRVVSRVRADPARADAAFALMWRTPIDPAVFQQQVTRVARDLPFSTDDLRRAIGRELGPTGAVFVSAYQKAG